MESVAGMDTSFQKLSQAQKKSSIHLYFIYLLFCSSSLFKKFLKDMRKQRMMYHIPLVDKVKNKQKTFLACAFF